MSHLFWVCFCMCGQQKPKDPQIEPMADDTFHGAVLEVWDLWCTCWPNIRVNCGTIYKISRCDLHREITVSYDILCHSGIWHFVPVAYDILCQWHMTFCATVAYDILCHSGICQCHGGESRMSGACIPWQKKFQTHFVKWFGLPQCLETYHLSLYYIKKMHVVTGSFTILSKPSFDFYLSKCTEASSLSSRHGVRCHCGHEVSHAIDIQSSMFSLCNVRPFPFRDFFSSYQL